MVKFSVKKPLTIFVVVVVIIALGVVSLLNMTPDLLPSIDLPYMVVMTTYAGATPEEVEKSVTKPLEQSLATLENLESIQSTSSANYSIIILEFENGASMDTAALDVLESVDIVEGGFSNEKIGSPYIMKINPTMLPITVAAVDMKDADTEKVSSFVEDTLLNELEGTTGVASISTGGILKTQINVKINADKIEALNDKIIAKADEGMADARKDLSKAKNEMASAKKKLKDSLKELENSKSDTYNQLSSAQAQLNSGIAQASAVSTQIAILEGRKAAIEAQINQGYYGEMFGVSLEELTAQLKDIESQLMVYQMNSETANSKVAELQAAYEQALNGSYTAVDSFTDGKKQIQDALNALESHEGELTAAQEQIDKASEEALKAADMGSMITMDMISGLLTAQNFSMPAGYIQEGTAQYLVSVGDEIREEDELENLLLFENDALGKVRLKDVAEVFKTDNSDKIYASINGNSGVLLTFSKQSNYATAEVSNNIKEKFEQLEGKHEGITFTILMDQGEYIYLIIDAILDSLLYGALFAIIVLFLFLRDIRPTFITLLSIPISIMFAILLMYFAGVTINMISLSGLAVAVGMLVDNSIVVIENIYRFRRMGVPPKKAAVAGAKEVAGAIVASTLTTVCVFAPIVFVQGITRRLFTDMALTIGFSLVASLLIALTLVPAISSMILRKEPKPEGKGIESVRSAYRKFLNWNLNHKPIVIIVAVGLLVFSITASLAKGFIFIPDMSTPQLSGSLTMNNEESTIEETAAVSDEALSRIGEVDGVKTVGGMLASSNMLTNSTASDRVTLYIILDEKTKRSGDDIAAEIEERCADLDCKVNIMTSSSVSEYTSVLGGSGVSVNVYCTDQDTLVKSAEKIGKELEKLEGIDTVDNGLVDAEPEYHFTVDKDKAMAKGLTVAQIYMQISSAVTHEKTGTSLYLNGGNYDIIISDGGAPENELEAIENLELTGTNAAEDEDPVLFKDVAKLEKTLSLPSIARADQRTYIGVSAALKEGYNVTLVTAEAEEALKNVSLDEGVTYSFEGENEMIMDAVYDLLKMMALAILLVYLIMAAQFQSLKSPFIIMFTIPLAFTGGLLALLIFGKEISIVALIGLVILVGVIVNNGIVLVDYINQLRSRGYTKRDAILEAGITRIRPVLMTSLTTVLGLLIMAIGKTAGTDMMQPLALVCIGGLIYATALTLLVVPVIYDLFNGEKYKFTKEEDIDVSDLIAE